MHRKQVATPLRDRKLVLVVEDDAWIRTFMRDVLSDEGYDVIEAADGRTGLRLAEENSPSIVLLDVAMPEFTGVDVLRHLRSKRRTRNLPVVVVSAYSRVLPTHDEALVAGILVKPFQVEQLLETVRQAIDPDESDESVSLHLDTSRGAATMLAQLK
jgi:DNA-binding response OmpR family regulator